MSEAQQESAPQEDALAGMILSAGEDEAPEATEPEQEAAKPEQPEASAEAEGASDDSDDEDAVSFDERQQAKLDKIIARNSYRYKTQIEQEQRRAQELEQRLQQLEQGGQPQASTDPETGAPVVPDFPDPFDPDFDDKVKARDEALTRRARWEADQEVVQYQQQQQAAQQVEEINKKAQSFAERGVKDYGLTAEDIQAAGEFIKQSGGLPVDLIVEILEDDAGPTIPQYLYRNPQELQKVQQMSPVSAARYIEREIRPKALRSAKRRAAPPPPVSTESGAGARDEDLPEGAAFL